MEFRDIGDTSRWIGDRFYEFGDFLSGIPLLSAIGAPILYRVAALFYDLSIPFYRADSWADIVSGAIGVILAWAEIREMIKTSWEWIDDIGGKIWEETAGNFSEIWDWIAAAPETTWEFVLDRIKITWDWIDDIVVKITDVVLDLLATQFDWITDFWGNVGLGIWDWMGLNLWGWLKDRAEDVVRVGGEILDLVWGEKWRSATP